MSTAPLFNSVSLSGMTLKNRMALAPLTRSRADAMGVPADFAATYYKQRSGAGLVITEATQVSFEGMGYCRTPGMHTDAQVAAWKPIVEGVQAEGAKIFAQLFHVGRIAHPLNRGVAAETVAPSAIQAAGEMYTDQEGMKPHPTPRELGTAEIARVADDFATAAKRAVEAGFDGVELHSANGYLLHQFLSSNANQRDDRYGGSIENRVRAPLEILDAMIAAIGADKLGIRVSPGHAFNDIAEDDTDALYAHYFRELDQRGLVYLHVMRPFANAVERDYVTMAREAYSGAVIACGNYDAESGAELIASGGADIVAYGGSFIANPDLPTRFREGLPLAEANPDTFYTPGPEGYTTYPAYAG